MYTATSLETSALQIMDEAKILETLQAFTGQAIVWYYDRLELLDSDALQRISLSEVLKLRAFNKDCELFVWRSNNLLKARIRTDKDVGNVNNSAKIAVDTSVFIDKVLTDHNEGFKLYEKIVTRNYIAESENGQAYYSDCRIVNLL